MAPGLTKGLLGKTPLYLAAKVSFRVARILVPRAYDLLISDGSFNNLKAKTLGLWGREWVAHKQI